MRLSMVYFLNHIRPHGKLYRGKNRKVRPITLKELNNLRKDYEREERNMLLLRHPYLTTEESYGHMKELRPNGSLFFEGLVEKKILKFSKQYTFAEALGHLRVKDAWD